MDEKIIELKKLPSGATVIVSEASGDTMAIEIGTGAVFVDAQDLYHFIHLLKEVDRHFLKKEE